MGTLATTHAVRIDEAWAMGELLKQLPTNKYKRIVTIGRGGLSVAQRVAYHLDLPVVQVQSTEELGDLGPKALFVDDISCTGETLLAVNVMTDRATLVTRLGTKMIPEYTGMIVAGDKYIHFSWEGDLK